MAHIVRILITILVLFLAFKLKTKICRSRLKQIILFVISFAVIICLVLFPIENIFVTFKTPESIFNYVSSGNLIDTIYGKDSCLFVYSKAGGVISYEFALKTNDGYKMTDHFNPKKVSSKFDPTAHFDVYQIRDTSDYYVIGSVNGGSTDYILYDASAEEVRIDLHVINERSGLVAFVLDEFKPDYYFLVNNVKVPIA